MDKENWPFVTTPKANLLPVLKLNFTNWKFCSHWKVMQAMSHIQKLKQDCFPKNMALLQHAESWLGILMLKPSVMTVRTPVLRTVQRVKNLFYKQTTLCVFGETVKQQAVTSDISCRYWSQTCTAATGFSASGCSSANKGSNSLMLSTSSSDCSLPSGSKSGVWKQSVQIC